jgi:acyl carrier protein
MDYKSEVRDIIMEVTGLEADELTGDEKFSDEFGIESVSVLAVINRIETRYGIEIPERRYSEMNTLDNVVRVITELARAR